MENKKIKLGFVGTGWVFRVCLAPFFKSNNKFALTAICDNSDKAKENAEQFEIKRIYSDYSEMLNNEKLDAVVIATPPYLHKNMTIEALNKNLHVFCEKPPSINTTEVKEMIGIAKKKKKVLYFGLCYRFMDNSVKLKEIVQSGKLGTIYYGKTGWLNSYTPNRVNPADSWKTKKEFAGGGILLNQGVHTIDRTLWALNYPKPVSVYGKIFNSFRKEIFSGATVEDLATGFINFENGFSLYIENSELINGPEVFYYTDLFGTAGGISIYRDKKATLYSKEKKGLTVSELVENLEFDGEAIFIRQAEYFAQCLSQNTIELPQHEQAIILMKIIDGLYESANSGNVIKIQ